MKKLISILVVGMILVGVLAPSQPAEAQVLMSRKCCDVAGNVRCVLENWTPVGNACFCYGQGWGVTC